MKGFIEVSVNEGFVVTVSVAHIESVAPMVPAEGREQEMEREFPGCHTIINTVKGQLIVKEAYSAVRNKITEAQ